MRVVHLSTKDWSVHAFVAGNFADRLFGTFHMPPGSALVLRSRSVHSFGQRAAMDIVGLDGAMRVLATRRLEPNRVALFPSARMIVELPAGSPLPALDDRVEMTDG